MTPHRPVAAGDGPFPLETAFLPEQKALFPDVDDAALSDALRQRMERSIGRNPRDLRSHVQRIAMRHRDGDAPGCFDALADLFIVLGPRGQALRANLLWQARDLLPREQFEFLRRHLDHGLDPATPLPVTADSLLTLGVAPTTVDLPATATTADELLQRAIAAIAQGRDDVARRYLEHALDIDPGHTLATMELLALYRRNGWRNEFLNTWTRLSSRRLALPEIWETLDRRFQRHPPQRRTIDHAPRLEQAMTERETLEKYHLLPSPAGAFYAVSGTRADPMRRLLLALMAQPETRPTALPELARASGIDDETELLELLHQAQTLSWIQGFDTPQTIPTRQVAKAMEQLLAPLSAVGKGLLVDWNGFAFARHGIDDDTAAALSALATDIAAVEQRHAERLRQTLGVSSQGWAAVDAHGASRIGAWPLFIADHRFLIVLQGAPRLNQPQFVELVWLLVSRYG